MSRWWPALALGLALGAGAARAEELDRVVAVVRGRAAEEPHVLTLSRVEEETRIALVSRGGLRAATEPLDGAALRAGLDWLVGQTLLAEEAARLRVFDVSAALSQAELARFRARFASPADYDLFLARLDLPEPELEAILRRTLRVALYVESKLALTGHAPDRAQAEAEALLRDLRARAEVRILGLPEGGR
jgi:hypothetical protein